MKKTIYLLTIVMSAIVYVSCSSDSKQKTVTGPGKDLVFSLEKDTSYTVVNYQFQSSPRFGCTGKRLAQNKVDYFRSWVDTNKMHITLNGSISADSLREKGYYYLPDVTDLPTKLKEENNTSNGFSFGNMPWELLLFIAALLMLIWLFSNVKWGSFRLNPSANKNQLTGSSVAAKNESSELKNTSRNIPISSSVSEFEQMAALAAMMPNGGEAKTSTGATLKVYGVAPLVHIQNSGTNSHSDNCTIKIHLGDDHNDHRTFSREKGNSSQNRDAQ